MCLTVRLVLLIVFMIDIRLCPQPYSESSENLFCWGIPEMEFGVKPEHIIIFAPLPPLPRLLESNDVPELGMEACLRKVASWTSVVATTRAHDSFRLYSAFIDTQKYKESCVSPTKIGVRYVRMDNAGE